MQVLLGLQANALKFTREGSVKILVSIIEEKNVKRLQIAVQDTGIGISEQDQKKLFKLFGFLKDQQKMNTKGIGLGLVIAKQIVSQFNGTIELQSEVGVGSTFTFTFELTEE